MNKAELVEAIVAESGATKNTVAEVLKAFEDVVVGNVSKGEKIVLSGFLSFERVERKARTARNPQTGEAIQRRRWGHRQHYSTVEITKISAKA